VELLLGVRSCLTAEQKEVTMRKLLLIAALSTVSVC
jgi:hypothetical protein